MADGRLGKWDAQVGVNGHVEGGQVVADAPHAPLLGVDNEVIATCEADTEDEAKMEDGYKVGPGQPRAGGGEHHAHDVINPSLPRHHLVGSTSSLRADVMGSWVG